MAQRVLRTPGILLDLLEQSYRSEYTERARRGIRFSDAGAGVPDGDKCEREIVYDLMDTKRQQSGESTTKKLLSSGSLTFFADGRLFESDLRRRLVQVLRSPEKELFDPDTGAYGKIDNIVYIKAVAQIVKERMPDLDPSLVDEDPILEIKTVNQFQFDEMARGGYILQTYYDQVQKYMFADRKRWAIVLIKNRNGFGEEHGRMPFIEYVIFPDQDRFIEIQNGLILTKKAAEKSVELGQNILPRPFERTSTKCAMCRFKLECWGPEKPAVTTQVVADPAVKAPSAELLESAMRVYAQTSDQMNALKATKEEAEGVIKQFFTATGQREVMAGEIRAVGYRGSRSFLSEEVLRAKLTPEQYIKLAKPTMTNLEEAIARREIDASILDEAKKVTLGEVQIRVTVTKPKSQKIKQPKEAADGGSVGVTGGADSGAPASAEAVHHRGRKGSPRAKSVPAVANVRDESKGKRARSTRTRSKRKAKGAVDQNVRGMKS